MENEAKSAPARPSASQVDVEIMSGWWSCTSAAVGDPAPCRQSAADQRRRRRHRCDKRLQRLQKILCKRVYYFVHVCLNKKLEEIS